MVPAYYLFTFSLQVLLAAVYKFSRTIVEKFKSFKKKEEEEDSDENDSLNSEDGFNEIERSNLGASRILSRIRHSLLNSFDVEDPNGIDGIERSNVGTSRILSRIRDSFLNSFDAEDTNVNTESEENNHFCCFPCFKNCCECHGMNQDVTHDCLEEERTLNESCEGIFMKELGKEV